MPVWSPIILNYVFAKKPPIISKIMLAKFCQALAVMYVCYLQLVHKNVERYNRTFDPEWE